MKLILAIGGSSGSTYALKLIQWLQANVPTQVRPELVFSSNALINWEMENGAFEPAQLGLPIYNNRDFFAPFASGSARYDAMVIIPASMGLIGRIANGISDDLISRAADVMLKERRKLIIVPREAPYNLVHLRNMTALCEAGAIICPASPSFYSQPADIDALVMTIIHRIIDLLGIDSQSKRWGSESL